MTWLDDKQREAANRVATLLERPMAHDRECVSCDDFDPWEIVPCLYGTYSSDFDDMAIKVLENLDAGEFDGEGLAHHMFREMLCNAELCDYGSSPRVCFPTSHFKAILPRLLERWKAWRGLQWQETS